MSVENNLDEIYRDLSHRWRKRCGLSAKNNKWNRILRAFILIDILIYYSLSVVFIIIMMDFVTFILFQILFVTISVVFMSIFSRLINRMLKKGCKDANIISLICGYRRQGMSEIGAQIQYPNADIWTHIELDVDDGMELEPLKISESDVFANENEIERKCANPFCPSILTFDGFLITNADIGVDECKKMWNNKKLQFYCCSCYKIGVVRGMLNDGSEPVNSNELL